MRVNLTIEGTEVAYKENKKKKYWKINNKDYFIKMLKKYKGNISNVKKVSNRQRGIIARIVESDPDLKKFKRNCKRKEKTKRGTVIQDGYEVLRINGKPVRYHRYLMEKKLQRKLNSTEIVHHIDCNKLNNSIDNLFVCKNVSEHNLIHDNLEKLASRLVQCGIIVFCPDTKEYVYVHTFPEKAKELLGL